MAASTTTVLPFTTSYSFDMSKAEHIPSTPEMSPVDESPLTTPEPIQYEEPLYTEINIPLPRLHDAPEVMAVPAVPGVTMTSSKSRCRAHTLHSFYPFHRHRPSTPTSMESNSDTPKSPPRRIELSMRDASKGGKKRSGTIDAAVVPAVMVLRAELFTPGEKVKRKVEGGLRIKEGIK